MFDLLVAAVVLVLGQLEAWAGAGATHRQGPPWAEALAYGLGAVLLLARRVEPLGVFAALVAVYVLEFAVFGSPEGFGVAVPPMIAAYSVARWEQRRPAWWGLVLVLVLGVAWIGFDPVPASTAARARQAVWWSPWVIAWLVGALVRGRVQNAEQRRLRREERASRAVTEERNRIARELHDVIGHSVSIMTVQASAVRRRLDDGQVAEREALETVETTGRQALAEMRRMVGVLRQSGEEVDREPAPGLAELTRLVERFRGAGPPTPTTREIEPSMTVRAVRLNHAVLFVADLERSIAFYQQAFDMVVMAREPRADAAFLRLSRSGNHHDLGLFGVGAQPPRPRGSIGLYHLAWQVDTIEELEEARLTLANLDAYTGESSHGATKSIYGRDPDGNEFEVMWMLPKASWGDFANAAPVERLDLPGEVRRWAGVRTAAELVPVDAS